MAKSRATEEMRRPPDKSCFRPAVQKCTEILTDERIPELVRYGFFLAGTLANLAITLLPPRVRQDLLFPPERHSMQTWCFAYSTTSYIFEAGNPSS